MQKARFIETQIITILKEAESGILVKDLAVSKHGISDATYYNWKSKYGGMDASDLNRMKEMEAEMSRLKRMYADLALENRALKADLKKALRPSEKREAVCYLIAEHRLSIQRSCRCVGLARAAYHRPTDSASETDQEVISALNRLIERHPRWGVLEILQGIAPPGPPLEPQAGLPGLLQLAVEPKAPDEKKATKEGETPLLVPQQPNQV